MGLSDGRKSFRIGLAVLIQYRSVTDTQPPSHVAVAITLNAQASSLKIEKGSGFTSITRSSADADNRLDAFSRQSRSTNMVPFHMLHIASYCAIVTLSFTVFVFKNFMTLKWGSKVTQGHWECYHSIDCVWFPLCSLLNRRHKRLCIRIGHYGAIQILYYYYYYY